MPSQYTATLHKARLPRLNGDHSNILRCCYFVYLISAYPDKPHAKERNFPQVEVMALFLIRKLTANLREIAITIYNPLILLLNKILNKSYSR